MVGERMARVGETFVDFLFLLSGVPRVFERSQRTSSGVTYAYTYKNARRLRIVWQRALMRHAPDATAQVSSGSVAQAGNQPNEDIRRNQTFDRRLGLSGSMLVCLSNKETNHYARLVQEWVASIGLDPAKFGTHSLRRTKAVLIYRRTGNLRAVQLLLGHSKIESTVRYLGIEVDDAIEIAKKVDI